MTGQRHRPESTSTQSRDYPCCVAIFTADGVSAGININPVAGLPCNVLVLDAYGIMPESTSTQSRDYPLRCPALYHLDCRAGININPVAGLPRRGTGDGIG